MTKKSLFLRILQSCLKKTVLVKYHRGYILEKKKKKRILSRENCTCLPLIYFWNIFFLPLFLTAFASFSFLTTLFLTNERERKKSRNLRVIFPGMRCMLALNSKATFFMCTIKFLPGSEL